MTIKNITRLFGVFLFLATAVYSQAPKTVPLELKVEAGRGAQCILRPVVRCGAIPTNEHGIVLFEYNPDNKTGWLRINRPEKDTLISRITSEVFVERGNQGTLLLTFEGGYFSGFASFTLYPFRYNYANPGQHTGGIMLTSGAVRVNFHPEEPK